MAWKRKRQNGRTDGMKNDDKDTKGKSHKEMQPKMTLCREASNLAPFFIFNHESMKTNWIEKV